MKKGTEKRLVLVEIEDEVIGMYEDQDECQHGCNGSPCNGERCTFICHPDHEG